MTEDEFRKLCKNHDLTYQYSDDGPVWRRGQASYDNLVEASKKLPREVAVHIYNEVVDTKLKEGYRDGFYWGYHEQLAF